MIWKVIPELVPSLVLNPIFSLQGSAATKLMPFLWPSDSWIGISGTSSGGRTDSAAPESNVMRPVRVLVQRLPDGVQSKVFRAALHAIRHEVLSCDVESSDVAALLSWIVVVVHIPASSTELTPPLPPPPSLSSSRCLVQQFQGPCPR